MRAVLAGDLGGTKCRLALVAEDLSIHGALQFETPREQAPFLAAFDRAVAQVLGAVPAGLAAPQAMGLGIAGVVVPAGDRIDCAPSVPLVGYPLADHVRERFGLGLALLNDGRASALGEHLRGDAAGSDPLLCLFFGTGIGVGLIAGGSPFAGARNAAGEIGHTVFRPGGRRCPCGAEGHFEAWCGGRAITERAAAEIGAPEHGGAWTVGDVVAISAQDDQRGGQACRILDEAAEAACVLVANACTLLNPAAVVLGGGVLAGWPELGARIERYVREHTTRLIHEGLRFVPSRGGADAILRGAAAATGALRG